MNIHKNWMTNNQYFGDNSQSLELKNLVQSRFDTQRYYSLEGFSVNIINNIVTNINITEQVVIQDFTNPLNEYREDRKIHFELNSVAQRGSYIYWKNRYWLILTKVESNEAYLSAKITECNRLLKWKNVEGKTIEQYCVITDKLGFDSGIKENKNITLGVGEFALWFQDNSETRKLTRNKRFILNNQLAYEITNIDYETRPGIATVFVLEHQINNENDDLINEIADANNQPTYTISIINNDLDIHIDDEISIETEIKLDGVLVSSESGNINITYISSDEDICTVDEDGMISGVGIGSASIRASLTNNSSIYDDLNIAVSATPIDNISEIIVGSNSISSGMNSTYEIYKYINGVDTSNTYIWSIVSGEVTILSYTNNSCVIRADDDSGNVVLKAKNNTSGDEITKTITLSSLW